MSILDEYIGKGDLVKALNKCIDTKDNYTGILLSKIWPESLISKEASELIEYLKKSVCESESSRCDESSDEKESVDPVATPMKPDTLKPRLVKLLCNWASSEDLCACWDKMSKGDCTWNSIKIVSCDPCDYTVVINSPPNGADVDMERTILFQMEPNMSQNRSLWGDWADPPRDRLLFAGTHDVHYNNNEWHLSWTYEKLMRQEIEKDASVCNVLSTVLSDKYQDPGHIKRVDFVKFLESKKFPVHVYGGNKFGWSDYKGTLPPHCKDEGMFPYKYTFNAENNQIRGYYTEKLIDGILAETLVFYNGCPNIRDYINPKAFVWLELVNFEKDYQTIRSLIEGDEWSKRIEDIRIEKRRILNELQFFPRLEKIIDEHSK